jgi:type IV fimbrial biogenesis protein FimT
MLHKQCSFYTLFGCVAARLRVGGQPNREQGFTAIEFLLVLAAASVIFVSAVSAASQRNDRLLVDDAARNLQLSLAFARNQAISRRSSVRVCPATQLLECAEDGNWNDGLIVLDRDSGEVLRLIEPSDKEIRFVADAGISRYVQFNELGDAFGTAGEFQVCYEPSPNYVVGLRVAAVGLVAHFDTDGSQCIQQG